MNLEEQVLTIEQAKHLQELGLDMSDAALWYTRLSPANVWNLIFKTEHCETLFNKPAYHDCYCPTYTLQEVLNRLEQHTDDIKLELSTHSIGYRAVTPNRLVRNFRFISLNDLLKSAYYLLCWSIENGYMEENK